AVCSLFIFLDLLERQSERITEFLLAHSQHHSTHAYPATYMLVDRVGSLLCHPPSPRTLPRKNPQEFRRHAPDTTKVQPVIFPHQIKNVETDENQCSNLKLYAVLGQLGLHIVSTRYCCVLQPCPLQNARPASPRT